MIDPAKCHCCLIDLPNDNSTPFLSMQCSFLSNSNEPISFLNAYLDLNRLSGDKNRYLVTDLNICVKCTIQLENAYIFREMCRQTEEWRVESEKPNEAQQAVSHPKTPTKQTKPRKLSLKCSTCRKVSMNPIHAAAHKLMHKAVKLKTGAYRCSVCPKVYFCDKSFRKHFLRWHVATKAAKQKCPECFNLYSAKYLPDHIKLIHQKVAIETIKEKEVVNDELPKTIVTGETSVNNNNSSEIILKCQHCPKIFASSKGYNEHVRAIHLKQYLRCARCPKEFKYRSSLYAHSKNCNGTIE